MVSTQSETGIRVTGHHIFSLGVSAIGHLANIMLVRETVPFARRSHPSQEDVGNGPDYSGEAVTSEYTRNQDQLSFQSCGFGSAGDVNPKWRQIAGVAMRPRGVRCR